MSDRSKANFCLAMAVALLIILFQNRIFIIGPTAAGYEIVDGEITRKEPLQEVSRRFRNDVVTFRAGNGSSTCGHPTPIEKSLYDSLEIGSKVEVYQNGTSCYLVSNPTFSSLKSAIMSMATIGLTAYFIFQFRRYHSTASMGYPKK